MAVVTREAGSRLRTLSWSFAIVPLTVVAVALAIMFAGDWLYADRALPGVTVAGVDVGSLKRDAVRERLDTELARLGMQSDVVATYDGRSWATTNGALGVRPDVAAAVDAAVGYGKEGPILRRFGSWMDSLRGQAQIPLTLHADGDALAKWIGALATDVDVAPVSGSLVASSAGLEVKRPVVGRELDRAGLAATVLAARTLADREIALPVRALYPEVDASGFDEAYAAAQAITVPLRVTVEDRVVNEDSAGLASLIRFDRIAAKPDELAPLPAGALAPATRYRYVATVDDTRLSEWVAALAAKLDRPAVSARYTVSKEGTLGIVAGTNGIRIDQEKMRERMRAQLVQPASGTRDIAAPSGGDTTAFTTDMAREWLSKLSRTSSYTTAFPVNPSRYANISTGSSQFDGVVIMPGQTFSFWSFLGPVTYERGYRFAGAIIEGRSDENVIGGGLCQVSTTIFNAVSRLGYEIVERHEHGYLVERYPLGLDAAVFEPGLDFRWRNDTGSPVFLWSWVSNTSVTFDVWGMPTGRTVSFSDPVQRNFVDVPKTQPADPAFPKGYAIRGRDVIRTRTVTDGSGKVVHFDTFFSHYLPVWGGLEPGATEPSTIH